MTTRLPLLLGLAALVVAACGSEEQPPPKKTPTVEVKGEAKTPPPASTGTTGGGEGSTTFIDPFATDGWANEDDDGEATMGLPDDTTGGSGGEPVEVPRYDGPCFVRWSGGPILRFKYAGDGTGGRLRIDGDNDGTLDVCARFWTKDQRTNKVTVDNGCDKSTDAIITPKYDEAAGSDDPPSNLATATYTDKSGESETKHEITLITLPAFTGIAPGYPLYAKREDIDIKLKDGRVTQAKLKKPIEGPPVKVTLKYDNEGQVKRIDEDLEADGKIDRRFDYRYDDVGNVIGMTMTETDYSEGKRKKTKKKATLGYRCWSKQGK